MVGLPERERSLSWVEWLVILGGILPVVAVERILSGYDVPGMLAFLLALGWAFPSLLVASRIVAWRERQPHRE